MPSFSSTRRERSFRGSQLAMIGEVSAPQSQTPVTVVPDREKPGSVGQCSLYLGMSRAKPGTIGTAVALPPMDSYFRQPPCGFKGI